MQSPLPFIQRGLLFSLVWLWSASQVSVARAGEMVDGDGWVDPGEPVEVRVANPAADQRLVIFLDATDITAVFAQTRPGHYRLQREWYAPPPGRHTLIVYAVNDRGEWLELERRSLNLLSEGGFETAEMTPELTLTIDSQWDEGHSGDTPPPERHNFHDASLQFGLRGHHARQGLEITSSMNVVGATHKASRLRYGELQNGAPPVDLSDYLVQAQIDDLRVELGHVNYGENPLLSSSVANRGVLGSYRLNDRFDIALSWQNGTSITGYNNLLGLSRSTRHYIAGGTLGWRPLSESENPLRIELSYLKARIESESNFDVGEVTDAEQSRGWGLRVLGEALNGRLRYNANYARSRFVNPTDPFLFQNDNLVPVRQTTDSAWFLAFTYDLFDDSGDVPPAVNAALTLTYERTDPLYRSLAASPQADIARYALSLQGAIDNAQWSLHYRHDEDNIDNIPSVLKTRTVDTGLTLALPLRVYLEDPDSETSFYPDLSFSAQRVHQYAINNPGALGGFNSDSHLPDQMNDVARLGLSWAFDRWDIGYELEYSNQDNRQIGRDLADFLSWGHSVNLALRPTDTLSVNVSVGRVDTRDREQALNSLSDTGSLAVDYQWSDRLGFNVNYSKSLDHDSLDRASSRTSRLDLGLTYRFDMPATREQRVPGQLYLRYARDTSRNKDNTFGFDSRAGTWTLSSGLSLSFR